MRYIGLFGVMGLLTGLVILAWGCLASRKAVDAEANSTGQITAMQCIGNKGTIGRLLIEAPVVTEGALCVDKYLAIVKDETLIFRQDGGDPHRVTFEALRIGQQVQVRFSWGPVAESILVRSKDSQCGSTAKA